MPDQALIDAAEDLFGIFGRPATYNGQALRILVEGYGQAVEQSPGVVVADAVITVRRSDVSQPRRNDTVAWGDVSYRVAAVLDGDGQDLVWKLAVNRNTVQG